MAGLLGTIPQVVGAAPQLRGSVLAVRTSRWLGIGALGAHDLDGTDLQQRAKHIGCTTVL